MLSISPDTDLDEKPSGTGAESSAEDAEALTAEPAAVPAETEAIEPCDMDAPSTPDMEAALEKVKQACTRYNACPPDKNLKATRALSLAIVACKTYINDHAQTDRGCAQRLVRALEEPLSQVRIIAGLFSDPKSLNRLHTRRLAEEHLDRIEEHLSSVLKAADDQKGKEITGWVNSHPVFGGLRKMHIRKLPQSVYILLFRKNADGLPELVTERAKDGRIFTRFRPHEFTSDQKLFKDYQNKAPILGAAVISTGTLHKTMGTLPEPPEGKDLLQYLVSLSNSAAAAPAREFIQLSPVLNQLHEMSRQRKFDSDTYVLLFQVDSAGEPQAASGDPEADISGLDSPEVSAVSLMDPAEDATSEAPVEVESIEETELPAEADASVDVESAVEPALELETEPEIPAEPVAEAEDEVAATTEPESPETTEGSTDAEPDRAPERQPKEKSRRYELEIDTNEDLYGPVPVGATFSIMTKKTDDGRIFTRYKAIDFVARKALYESFKGIGTISGAAVIKGRTLLKIIGHVPQATEKSNQLAVLMDVSAYAMEGPSKDYVAANEVLQALFDLSNSNQARNADVVVFTVTEGGKLEVMPVRDERNRMTSKIPLSEFQYAKAVHTRFANLTTVVGASVIGDYAGPPSRSPTPTKGPGGGSSPPGGGRPGGGQGGRPGMRMEPRRQVVLAAFGRTPLKKDLLATPETFARLRINL